MFVREFSGWTLAFFHFCKVKYSWLFLLPVPPFKMMSFALPF